VDDFFCQKIWWFVSSHFLFPPGTLIEQNAGGASGALGDFWPRLTQVGGGGRSMMTRDLCVC